MKLALLVRTQRELKRAVRRLSAVKIPAGCAKCLVEFNGRETIILPAYEAQVAEKLPRKSSANKCKIRFRTTFSP